MKNLYKWVLLVTVALWDAMSFRVAHLSFVLQVIGKNGLAIFAKCIMGSSTQSSASQIFVQKYHFRGGGGAPMRTENCAEERTSG